MKKFDYVLILYKLKINIFLFIIKFKLYIYINIFNLSINLLLLIPDRFYSFINSELYIDSDSGFDSESESDSGFESESDSGFGSDSELIKEINNNKSDINSFPINNEFCISLNNKKIDKDLKNTTLPKNTIQNDVFDNTYIYSLLDKINTKKSFYILYAEILNINNSKDNSYISYQKTEITKKIKIIYKFHNTLNISKLNYYFNNPNYLIIIYHSFYKNTTLYRIFDLKNNKDITINKTIMFGEIKL